MIGPRACGPRKLAPEVLRESALPGVIISSFDIVITWVTRKTSASCVTPSRRPLSYRRLIDRLMRQPRRYRRGDKAPQAVKDERGDAAARSARAIHQFRCDERDRADDQHPGNRANSLDVKE